MREVMSDMEKCCGCRACEQTCPAKAISMQVNEEGFSYPYIDKVTCVNCGKCEKVCHIESGIQRFRALEVFAAVHKNKKVLLDSTSGGAFTAIAEGVFNEGGAVVGCVMDSDFRARQVIIKDRAWLPGLRGSKYVQSDTGDTYTEVRALLDKHVLVFYTGTPCQIAGLKSYLGVEYENLLTADLVCHGVPSPKLFKHHIHWLQKKEGHPISQFRFRCKMDPIKKNLYYYYYSHTDNAKIVHGSAILDPYYYTFLHGETYRESCYQCPYSEENRVGDFTLADYLHVERYHPELKDAFGVSTLMINTEKGMAWKHMIDERMELVLSKMEWAKEINYNLNKPVERPAVRDAIYQAVKNGTYSQWADGYCSSIGWKVRYAYGKLPSKLRRALKKLMNGENIR